MKTIRRRKRRRLSKQTKIFLSFTILVLGLIGLCLFSYPKLDLKNKEIDIGLDEDFNNLWGLNPDDFADMKKGEVREVFINLED